ncbi:kinase-like domain-containing protein [Hyaloraphidium curvatum]|nr:kinase-like domain-containing protein [Hyaloraphidium curvatum]
MAYLHSFNVLHGNLKCSNVLVDEGRALITDFGLSHIRDRATAMEFEWNEGRAIGVFDEDRFVSPELMSGEPLRAPADTFAFAMLCYVVVSRGRYPFGDKSNGTALIYAVLHKDERPQRPEGTPNGVWQLMQQCWARDPAQRPPFATVRDQLQELRNSRAEVPAAVLYK